MKCGQVTEAEPTIPAHRGWLNADHDCIADTAHLDEDHLCRCGMFWLDPGRLCLGCGVPRSPGFRYCNDCVDSSAA